MAQKLLFTYIITLFFNNLYRCNLCHNHDKLYKLYKYYIKIVRMIAKITFTIIIRVKKQINNIVNL